MGMLGLSLVFVGIVLIMNGAARLSGIDSKSTAFMNFVTGSVLVVGNFIMLSQSGGELSAFHNVASGFLFGFTYLFIAANHVFSLDWRAFGWYSLCVAIYATIMAIVTVGDIRLNILWGAWAVLWLEGFLEIVVGWKKLGKIFPYLSMTEGVFAAFIPAVLMLLGRW